MLWMAFAAASATVLVLIWLVLRSWLRLRIRYTRYGANDEVDLTVTALYGIVRLRYKVPSINLKPMLSGVSLEVKNKSAEQAPPAEKNYSREEMLSFMGKVEQLIQNVSNYKAWFFGTMRDIHVTELRWQTELGFGDAPETGVAAGLTWAVKSSVIGLVSRLLALEANPLLQVKPLFQETALRTDIAVEGRIRVYRLLWSMLKLTRRIAQKDNGFKVWGRILWRSRIREKQHT